MTSQISGDLIVRVNKLALQYGANGRFNDAEAVLSRLVNLCRRPQISDRMQLAASLNNLGLLYMRQKRYGKAEPLLQSSLMLQQDLLDEQIWLRRWYH